jgi:hypothetical protein
VGLVEAEASAQLPRRVAGGGVGGVEFSMSMSSPWRSPVSTAVMAFSRSWSITASRITAPATTISARRASNTRRRSSADILASASTALPTRLRVARRSPPPAAKETTV